MEVGKDYIITRDPYSTKQEDWVVILKTQFPRVVGRYSNIRITEKGTNVSFDFEQLYCPETANVEGNETEFDKHLGEVLLSVLRDNNDTNVYYNMNTGSKIEH